MADYLKIPELARQLDVSEQTARRMVKDGRIPSVFVGGAYRVKEEDLRNYLEAARVEVGSSPKVQASLWPEEEPERRDVYEPWLEFVNNYADRWEQRIAQEALNLGAIHEFIGTMEDLAPVLGRLGLQEKQEHSPESIFSFGRITGEAIARLMDLMDLLIKAGVKQFEETDIARLRRSREQWANEPDQAASG
jgi:excisionase family DNA binding protein